MVLALRAGIQVLSWDYYSKDLRSILSCDKVPNSFDSVLRKPANNDLGCILGVLYPNNLATSECHKQTRVSSYLAKDSHLEK